MVYYFSDNPYKWSAFRSQDYGYTKFKAYNTTHIVIEQVSLIKLSYLCYEILSKCLIIIIFIYSQQVSVDLDGSVIDSFWLVKDKKLKFDKL